VLNKTALISNGLGLAAIASIPALIFSAYFTGIKIEIRCNTEILKKANRSASDKETNVAENPFTSQELLLMKAER